jgi:predicted PurR-regulated permease PerM
VRGNWNKEEMEKGAILTISLCLVVLFSQLIGEIDSVKETISSVISAVMPLIMGCVIAFLLSPVLNFLKRKMTDFVSSPKKKSGRRLSEKGINAISVILTFAFFILAIILLLWILIPELRNSIVKLYGKLPSYIDNIQDMIGDISINNQKIQTMMSKVLVDVEGNLNTFVNETILPNMNTIIVTISTGVVVSVKFVMNFFISIIIAIYILNSKDKLKAQCKKIIYSIFSKRRGNKVLYALNYMNNVFSGFINGKIIDSIIVGLICAIFCCCVNMPYAVLVSVIVGVTNIIPFFGPFIGGIPCAILVLVESPKMGIMFIVFVIILQQVDGNIIGPLILGDSIGLSGLWIMIAIIVGGNLFGLAGMILGVPVFACIYALVSAVINDKLRSKGMNNETAYYLTLSGFDEENGEPIRNNNQNQKHDTKKEIEKKLIKNKIYIPHKHDKPENTVETNVENEDENTGEE